MPRAEKSITLTHARARRAAIGAVEAQAQLAAIVASSDDAIVGKTLDGIITSWNPAAERMFGFTADEALGQSILLIIPEDRRDEETHVITQIRAGQRVDHFETVRRTKDGRLIDISITVSPIKDPQGRVIGASKVARDISYRKRADEERHLLLEREKSARLQAERALHAKDAFLATVSHELRSPLNAILGWTHILSSGTVDPATTKRAIDTINRNAQHQNQLISDILDVQRLTSGKFRLHVQLVDLALVIEAACDTMRPAAMAKGIVLVPSVHDVSNVPGDPDRLQQVVWNLLSNAVKFSPERGQITIGVRGHESHVEITVEDGGPGIKDEFMPFLFESFQQDASGRRKGGLGLGLAIVRHLVELHGGTVGAANRADQTGARFSVRLPRAGAAHQAVMSNAQQIDDLEATPSLHGVRVLLVDDEADAREVVAAVLGHCGADVRVATTAADAITLLAVHRPDVLVCDINMPDQHGYDLLRQIRTLSADEGGKTPAVALTAATTTEDRLRALRAGFQFHVPKPVSAVELACVVAGLARAKP